jgi:hypothetical protein
MCIVDSQILMLMEKRGNYVCMIILAADSMKSTEVGTVHAECVGKTPAIFPRKLKGFKKKKLAFARVTYIKTISCIIQSCPQICQL